MCEAERAWKASKIEQGKQETKKDMYKKMLDQGFTVEQIANNFVVSIESIEKLIG